MLFFKFKRNIVTLDESNLKISGTEINKNKTKCSFRVFVFSMTV